MTAVVASQLRDLEPSQREAAVTAYLSTARDRLHWALEATGPETVAALKAEIATAAEATKQLNLSKEIQEDSREMVRRAEYALGKAIRKGQEDGTVARRGDIGGVPPHAHSRGDGNTSISRVSDLAPDFHDNSGKGASIAQLSEGVTDEQFEEALTQAKSEGNVSRANVVRKIRGQQTDKLTGEKRLQRIEELANGGHASAQIARLIGHTEEYVRQLARDAGIEIPADRVLRGTHRLNVDKVVARAAQALEGTVLGLQSVDLTEVSPEVAQTWIDSLNQSINALRKATNQIKESIQ